MLLPPVTTGVAKSTSRQSRLMSCLCQLTGLIRSNIFEISGIWLSFWIELIFNYKNCSAPSRCKEIHPSEHQKCNCRVLQILNPTPFPLSFPCPLPLAQQCSLSLHQLPSHQEDYLCRSLQPSGTIMQSHLGNRRGPLPRLENPPFHSEASL